MTKQTRRAYYLSDEAHRRVEACATRLGTSKSFVLESVIASALERKPLDDLLADAVSSSPPDPSNPPPDSPLGGGICMF